MEFHGDPCVAKDFLEIYAHILKITWIIINTRKHKWWYENTRLVAKKVGKLFNDNKGKRWHITFSIDGLQNTTHLYRRNVVWGKLIANVKAYNPKEQ